MIAPETKRVDTSALSTDVESVPARCASPPPNVRMLWVAGRCSGLEPPSRKML